MLPTHSQQDQTSMRFHGSSTRAFTLVETLVAVTLLLLVIVGPMSIASKGMQNAYFAGDQTTATFLAQEAIEHIQSLRDNNALEHVEEYQEFGSDNDVGDNVWDWFESGPGTSGWGHCKDVGNGCDIDFTGPYRQCSIGDCQLQRYSGSGSVDRIYAYESGVGWSDSPYTRVIEVGPVTPAVGQPIAVPVMVTVSWQSSLFGAERKVVLQTYIYNNYSRFE